MYETGIARHNVPDEDGGRRVTDIDNFHCRSPRIRLVKVVPVEENLVDGVIAAAVGSSDRRDERRTIRIGQVDDVHPSAIAAAEVAYVVSDQSFQHLLRG